MIPTAHIETKNKNLIAKTVLMPGDPLRAKFIAENFLENPVQVKILPKELNQITEIILFGNKIAIFVYSDKPFVFLIEDKNLYGTYLKQFEFLWKKSKDTKEFK
jgi:hypothetical protein